MYVRKSAVLLGRSVTSFDSDDASIGYREYYLDVLNVSLELNKAGGACISFSPTCTPS